MTIPSATAYVVSAGLAMAVAILLQRLFRRGPSQLRTLEVVAVLGVLAAAAAAVFLA